MVGLKRADGIWGYVVGRGFSAIDLRYEGKKRVGERLRRVHMQLCCWDVTCVDIVTFYSSDVRQDETVCSNSELTSTKPHEAAKK